MERLDARKKVDEVDHTGAVMERVEIAYSFLPSRNVQ